MLNLTHSPLLKHRRFSLLHLFPHHFSRSGGFCLNPLRSFEVVTALNVAPPGVSVLPLHASLSACNRDMSLSCSCVWTLEQEHSQPYHQILKEQPAIEDLVVRLSHRGVSYAILNASMKISILQFISSLKVGAFLLIHL